MALRELPQRRRVDRDRPRAGAPGVGLDHQEDREEVEQCGDRGHHDHLQIRDVQELRDDERRRPERRRADDGADAGGRENGAAHVGLVARAPQHRPRDGAERDRVRDAAS